MKFRIEHVIILGLLIWLIVQTCADRDPEPNTEPWKSAIRQRETKIEELTQKATEEAQRRRQDSLTNIQTMFNKDRELNRSKAIIQRLKQNPVVIKVREENPEVDSLIVSQDSVIVTQQGQLVIQMKYISQLQMDIGQVQANFNERLKLTEQNYQDLSKIADAYQKENKKLKRRNKFQAILLPFALAGGFWLGSQ